MSILRHIVNRFYVLSIRFRDEHHYDMSMVMCRVAKDIEPDVGEEVQDLDEIKKKVGKVPLIVVLSGYGVISKDVAASPGIEAKITGEPENYRWNRVGDMLTFVRVSQVDELLKYLTEKQINPLATLLVADSDAGVDVAGEYISGKVNLRTIFQPSALGSSIAMLAFDKLKLPVLGLVLLALLVNFFASSGVENKYRATHLRFEQLRRESDNSTSVSKRKQQIIADFGRDSNIPFAVLCDRAAKDAPRNVTLTSLSIQPLLKSIEEGREIKISQKTMVVAGFAPDSRAISDYVSALQRQSFVREIKLASIEQNRETGAINFSINIGL